MEGNELVIGIMVVIVIALIAFGVRKNKKSGGGKAGSKQQRK